MNLKNRRKDLRAISYHLHSMLTHLNTSLLLLSSAHRYNNSKSCTIRASRKSYKLIQENYNIMLHNLKRPKAGYNS
jgi:hypothetical protein